MAGSSAVRSLYRATWPLASLYGRFRRRLRRLPAVGTPAREVLENTILPAIYESPGLRRVMFVGVAPYTGWYPSMFALRPGLRFSTADPDPGARAFGARRHHVVGRFEELVDEPDH